MKLWKLLLVLLFPLIFVWGIFMYNTSVDCAAKGGVLVNGPLWYACVEGAKEGDHT